MKLHHTQTGGATLLTVLSVLLILGLVAGSNSRMLSQEIRTSANFQHALRASAAAESGADWLLAALNSSTATFACPASAMPPVSSASSSPDSVTPFRSRMLAIDELGLIQLRATPPGPHASCTQSRAGWQCQCAGDEAQAAEAPGSQFHVQLNALSSNGKPSSPPLRPGVLQALISGCSAQAKPCSDESALLHGVGASTRIHVQMALVSALPLPPSAPLLARGRVTLNGTGSNAVEVWNRHPDHGGWLAQAGGALDNGSALLKGPPGSHAPSLLLAHQQDLSVAPAAFFQLYFGSSPEQYARHAALSRVVCPLAQDCAPQLRAAVDQSLGLVWVDGPAQLSSALELGNAEQPILLIIQGATTMNAAMKLHGLLYSHGPLTLEPGAAGTQIHGALVVGADLHVQGAALFNFEPERLHALQRRHGSFVRLPGSWAPQPWS